MAGHAIHPSHLNIEYAHHTPQAQAPQRALRRSGLRRNPNAIGMLRSARE